MKKKRRIIRRKTRRRDKDREIHSDANLTVDSANKESPERQSLIKLQKNYGNRAVQAVLTKRAHKGKKDDETLSGSIGPIEGEEIEREGGEMPGKEDAGKGNKGSQPGVALPIRAELSIESDIGRSQTVHVNEKSDPVLGLLGFGSKVTRGGVKVSKTAFGTENVKYSVDNIGWSVKKGFVFVKARIYVHAKWDTQSLGKTDISGASDPDVKKSTWKKIVKDLKPDASGRPRRKKYWAKDITEIHEKFHAKDDIGRALLYSPLAMAWLSTRQVIVPPTGFLRSPLMYGQVRGLLETVRSKVEADGWAYYDKAGGAGENRAYADGKPHYTKRVNDIKARASKEGWK
jgi:hypothetical protein